MFVKMCGFTRVEDLEKIIGLNVSAAGFVFYRKSKRNIEPEKAKELCSVIKGSGISATGVLLMMMLMRLRGLLNMPGSTCCRSTEGKRPSPCRGSFL